MTEERLKHLLHEVAGEVADRPMADAAWERAAGRRRRTRTAVVAAVAVVAVAGGGTFFAVRGGGDPGPLPSSAPSGSASGSPSASPSTGEAQALTTTYQGLTVWRAPDAAQASALARLPKSPLPEQIDVGDLAEARPLEPGTNAGKVLAAVTSPAERDRVGLVVAGGETWSVSLIRSCPEESRCAVDEVLPGSLSPEGDYLAVARGRQLRIIGLDGSGEREITVAAAPESLHWADVDKVIVGSTDSPTSGPMYDVATGESLGEKNDTVTISGFSGGTPYGPQVFAAEAAQSYTLDDIGLREFTGADEAPADVTVAVADGQVRLLAHPASDGERCCPAAAWTSTDTIAYTQPIADGEAAVVAWTVGSTDFRQVTRITGFGADGYTASFADFPLAG